MKLPNAFQRFTTSRDLIANARRQVEKPQLTSQQAQSQMQQQRQSTGQPQQYRPEGRQPSVDNRPEGPTREQFQQARSEQSFRPLNEQIDYSDPNSISAALTRARASAASNVQVNTPPRIQDRLNRARPAGEVDIEGRPMHDEARSREESSNERSRGLGMAGSDMNLDRWNAWKKARQEEIAKKDAAAQQVGSGYTSPAPDPTEGWNISEGAKTKYGTLTPEQQAQVASQNGGFIGREALINFFANQNQGTTGQAQANRTSQQSQQASQSRQGTQQSDIGTTQQGLSSQSQNQQGYDEWKQQYEQARLQEQVMYAGGRQPTEQMIQNRQRLMEEGRAQGYMSQYAETTSGNLVNDFLDNIDWNPESADVDGSGGMADADLYDPSSWTDEQFEYIEATYGLSREEASKYIPIAAAKAYFKSENLDQLGASEDAMTALAVLETTKGWNVSSDGYIHDTDGREVMSTSSFLAAFDSVMNGSSVDEVFPQDMWGVMKNVGMGVDRYKSSGQAQQQGNIYAQQPGNSGNTSGNFGSRFDVHNKASSQAGTDAAIQTADKLTGKYLDEARASEAEIQKRLQEVEGGKYDLNTQAIIDAQREQAAIQNAQQLRMMMEGSARGGYSPMAAQAQQSQYAQQAGAAQRGQEAQLQYQAQAQNMQTRLGALQQSIAENNRLIDRLAMGPQTAVAFAMRREAEANQMKMARQQAMMQQEMMRLQQEMNAPNWYDYALGGVGALAPIAGALIPGMLPAAAATSAIGAGAGIASQGMNSNAGGQFIGGSGGPYVPFSTKLSYGE